jgi:hypothetical protein
MARIAEFKYLDDDEERIGTKDYKGYAFFWAYDYRHYMRGFFQTFGVTERRVGQILQQMRRSVHRDFLRLGLDLADATDTHEMVIKYHHMIATAKLRSC